MGLSSPSGRSPTLGRARPVRGDDSDIVSLFKRRCTSARRVAVVHRFTDDLQESLPDNLTEPVALTVAGRSGES